MKEKSHPRTIHIENPQFQLTEYILHIFNIVF